MIVVGDSKQWWNRKLPMGRIGITTAALLALLLLSVMCGQVVRDLVWDVAHHRTARFRGQTLRLPWFWRQDELKEYNQLDLVRDRIGLITVPSQMTVSYDQKLDPKAILIRVNHEHETANRLGGKFPFYVSDASIDPHYSCMGFGFEKGTAASLRCYRLDGYWTVTLMFGSNADLPAFRKILQGVEVMGTPPK